MYRVVTAQLKDIPSWLNLAREVQPLFSPMVNKPSFLQSLRKNIKRQTAFCVRENASPPGGDLMGGLLLSSKPPIYKIGWLAVAKKHRQKGVGQTLVSFILEQIEKPAEIVVTTFGEDHPESKPAKRFYRKFGFIPAELEAKGPNGYLRQIYRLKLDNMVSG